MENQIRVYFKKINKIFKKPDARDALKLAKLEYLA
jgi:hypothetical protein